MVIFTLNIPYTDTRLNPNKKKRRKKKKTCQIINLIRRQKKDTAFQFNNLANSFRRISISIKEFNKTEVVIYTRVHAFLFFFTLHSFDYQTLSYVVLIFLYSLTGRERKSNRKKKFGRKSIIFHLMAFI